MAEAGKSISPVEVDALITWPHPEGVTEAQIRQAREIATLILRPMYQAFQENKITLPAQLAFVINLGLGEANPTFDVCEEVEVPVHTMRLPRTLQKAVEIARANEASAGSPT